MQNSYKYILKALILLLATVGEEGGMGWQGGIDSWMPLNPV